MRLTMAIPFSTITFLAAVAFIIHLLRQIVVKSRRNGFPKGPPSLPLLGNIHQIPPAKAFLSFTSWGRDPSTSTPDGIVGLRLGTNAQLVILNKWWHVRDLFDSREKGAIYSDRPFMTVPDHVLPAPHGSDIHLAFASYGPKWRRLRRTVTEFLTDKEVQKLTQLQDEESTQMVWEFLQDCGPDKANQEGITPYRRYVMRYFAAVIFGGVFGQRGKDSGPQSKVMRFYACQDDWGRLLDIGGSPPFDVFPWLKYVPAFLTPWRRFKEEAAAVQRGHRALYSDLFSETKARLQAGKSQDCFVARILRNQEAAINAGKTENVYSQIEMERIGGFMLEAGADTTANSFESFLLAMAAYPEVQKEAQREIDAIFGPDEMPHTTDGSQLPFLNACFLETLRWRPILPTAIPHANTADDVYQGYSIPKATTVIANVWSISHDPDDFEDPDTYNPSRYIANHFGIKASAEMSKVGKDTEGRDAAAFSASEVSSQGRRQTYAFGAGRRVCAGSKMAENSMMYTMAKTLWAFDIVHAGSAATGPETDVRKAYRDSILSCPKEFPVVFRLRDERKRDIMRQEWEKADEMLSRFE